MKLSRLIIIILLFSFIFGASSYAQLQQDSQYNTSGGSGGTVTLNPPAGIGKNLTPQVFIGKIINSALGIVGSLALLMFIYGGFTWLTSAGSADKVTKGKNILVWATIGLVVIFMSYGATRFVLDKITAT